LSAWLKSHLGVEVVSRDRSPTYASGINDDAPGAVQVADRFLDVESYLRENHASGAKSAGEPISRALPHI